MRTGLPVTMPLAPHSVVTVKLRLPAAEFTTWVLPVTWPKPS